MSYSTRAPEQARVRLERERPAERRRAWTVGDLAALLGALDQTQCLVFTDAQHGDFDLVGTTGTCLSEDNFERDRRPILRLQKRRD